MGADMKCIVYGCSNQTHEGAFIGNFCATCYTMLTTGRACPSDAWFITENTALKIDLESLKAIADNWRVKAVEWSRENAELKQQVEMLLEALKECMYCSSTDLARNMSEKALAATEPKGEK